VARPLVIVSTIILSGSPNFSRGSIRTVFSFFFVLSFFIDRGLLALIQTSHRHLAGHNAELHHEISQVVDMDTLAMALKNIEI
jgi:hypothetical protein